MNAPVTGALLNQRYRLDSELGRGGMGIVYRGYDCLLDRPIAVKLLNTSVLGTEGRARLLREAQAAARLNHPNIVTVYDAGEDAGASFIVLELVEGASLHLRRPETIGDIVSVVRQVCAALDHAHSHDIAHRDLKPENVLITGSGTAKLMDFGLARSISSRLTTEGLVVGTVFYLAPEQALGQPVDSRADLYALGVMLYELITGRLPFSADDPLAIISQHLHAPVVPPRSYRADLPPALEAIILKLMAKNPADRFASAQEVISTLAQVETAGGAPAAGVTELGGSFALLEQLARGHLIGRRSEITQLRELWAHAQQGHGHLALLSGEPGVGKTRLAHELIVYAQLNGAVVLRGGCYEYEATTPYLPFIEALRQWTHSQSPETLRLQLGATAPELARLAPEIEAKLGPLIPNPPLTPNEERLRLYDHVARFLQSLAAAGGLLLFIDDLHWADQGTLSLLHYLLRHLRHDRLLVLAAYRTVELDRAHPLAVALVEWNRERLATRITLGRLPLDDTEALLAALFGQDSLSSEFCEAIYHETEGNPFFIEEVIKSLIEAGQIYRQDNQWQRQEITELAIPQSVKEAIGRRLNRLSQPCLDLLHTAAALGKGFTFSELVAVASQNEDQLLDALDEASAAQLIHVESAESFVFTHDKIREVLYGELNPIRRRRLHRRIGEGLEKLYAPDGAAHVHELAYHFIASGELAKGLSYALPAAEKAERLYAHDEALRFYEQAQESAEALELPGEMAVIYAAMAGVYEAQGLSPLAADYFGKALALTPAPEKRAVLKSKIGQSYAQVGDERGLEFLEAAVSELDPAQQTNELAEATAFLGRYHHYYSRHLQAIEFLERARQLAEPLDDVSTVTNIYTFLAGVYQHLTRFDKSMEWANQCIALGERKNYPHAVAMGYEFLAEGSILLGNWQDALKYAERDWQIGEKIGAQDRMAWSGYSYAWALYSLGRLLEAAERARAALALAEIIGEARLAVFLGSLLALVETDLGLDASARETAELAIRRADELNQIVSQCFSRHALAYWHIQHEEWSNGVVLYDRCAVLLSITENRAASFLIGGYFALPYWGQGDVPKAAEIITAQLAAARDAQARHPEAVCRRIQGQILASQHLWVDAAVAYDESKAILDELGSRLELGRVLTQRGLLHQTLNELGAAKAELSRALELFISIGARGDVAKTEALLDRLAARL